MKTVTFDSQTHLLVPLELPLALRLAAQDIGEGYQLSGDHVVLIYQSMLAAVLKQARLNCQACDGLGELYSNAGEHMGACPDCSQLPHIKFGA